MKKLCSYNFNHVKISKYLKEEFLLSKQINVILLITNYTVNIIIVIINNLIYFLLKRIFTKKNTVLYKIYFSTSKFQESINFHERDRLR